MSEPRAMVTMTFGQYAGYDLRLRRTEAENLVMTGQARWCETRPMAKVETPEAPDLSVLSKSQLATVAEARGIEVTRADGEDGVPLKSDFLRVLG